MAAPGRIIEGQSFRREVFQGENFSRISHCTFEDCVFHNCNFDRCVIARTTISGGKFNLGCSFRHVKLLGKNSFYRNNIEILDLRIAGRGYIVVMNKNGATIGCIFKKWTELQQGQKDQIKADGKNAVHWWKKYKPTFETIAKERGWIT